jgi:hypothetical protein
MLTRPETSPLISFRLFPIAGFLSGFVSVCFISAGMPDMFLGGIFGLFLATCIHRQITGPTDAREFWMAPFAAVVGFFSEEVAMFLDLWLGTPPDRLRVGDVAFPRPVDLFVGGAIGGTLLMLAAPLMGRKFLKGGILARIVTGGLIGGALALVGWALGPTLGVALWYAPHFLHLRQAMGKPQDNIFYGDADRIFSLQVVWQTGIATVFALWGGLDSTIHPDDLRLSV